jgi:hypothetical protein
MSIGFASSFFTLKSFFFVVPTQLKSIFLAALFHFVFPATIEKIAALPSPPLHG